MNIQLEAAQVDKHPEAVCVHVQTNDHHDIINEVVNEIFEQTVSLLLIKSCKKRFYSDYEKIIDWQTEFHQSIKFKFYQIMIFLGFLTPLSFECPHETDIVITLEKYANLTRDSMLEKANHNGTHRSDIAKPNNCVSLKFHEISRHSSISSFYDESYVKLTYVKLVRRDFNRQLITSCTDNCTYIIFICNKHCSNNHGQICLLPARGGEFAGYKLSPAGYSLNLSVFRALKLTDIGTLTH